MGYYNAGMGYSVPEIPPRPVIMVNAEGNTQVDTSIKKFGTGSCLLDGNSDWLQIDATYNSYLSFTGDFTFELWSYKTSNTDILQLFISNWKWGVWFGYATSTEVRCYVNDHTDYASATAYNNLNTWFHFAVVRSGTTVTIYVNGTASSITSTETGTVNMQASITAMGANTAYDSNTGNLNVQNFFTGYFDEIRFSDTARYTSNFTPATSAFINDTNTLLLLHCDGTDGSTTFLDDAAVLINYNVTVSNSVFDISGTPLLSQLHLLWVGRKNTLYQKYFL